MKKAGWIAVEPTGFSVVGSVLMAGYATQRCSRDVDRFTEIKRPWSASSEVTATGTAMDGLETGCGPGRLGGKLWG
ncbi:hypothetical protein ColTof4_10488 [Colletotrichum tofieldiae]|uniref:Uncharacterized protein n=1 Tax=Colletotrichum liriopes TaxID=708192 RepID=A0AA37GJH7_9PEZI|nr:hypothetical protein ColLi_04618 [Colletotrichum liriopes]GKT58518.1 hypothetical protein ColTof3_05857 [Colletotrichum tofieldiae]GKT78065.1 hypothetical protein ColTof4_10488 [Colletotrichum tofieldiae]GKT84609.1 hypothetical protein Ct61P_02459 [Colletotrichum tofieldiae]